MSEPSSDPSMTNPAADLETRLRSQLTDDGQLTLSRSDLTDIASARYFFALLTMEQIVLSGTTIAAAGDGFAVSGQAQVLGLDGLQVTLTVQPQDADLAIDFQATLDASQVTQFPGAPWFSIGAVSLTVTVSAGARTFSGVLSALIKLESVDLPITIQLPQRLNNLVIEAIFEPSQQPSLSALTSLVGGMDLGALVPTALTDVVGGLGLSALTLQLGKTPYLSLMITSADPWPIVPDCLSVRDLQIFLGIFAPLDSSRRQIETTISAVVDFGEQSAPFVFKKSEASEDWVLKLDASDFTLPGLDSLSNLFGGASLDTLMPGLDTFGALQLLNLEIQFNIKHKSLSSLAFLVNAADDWPLPGLDGVVIRKPTINLTIFQPLVSAQRATTGLVSGFIWLGETSIFIMGQRLSSSEPWRITGKLGDDETVNLSAIVSDLWPSVFTLPEMLPDFILQNIQVEMTPSTGAFTLSASSPTEWALPIGVGELKLENVQLTLSRSAPSGNAKRIRLAVQGQMSLAGIPLPISYSSTGDLLLTGHMDSIGLGRLIDAICEPGTFSGLPLPDALKTLALTNCDLTLNVTTKTLSLAGSAPGFDSVELQIKRLNTGRWGFFMGLLPGSQWSLGEMTGISGFNLDLSGSRLALASAKDSTVQLTHVGSTPIVGVDKGLTLAGKLSLGNLWLSQIPPLNTLIPANTALDYRAVIGATAKDFKLSAPLFPPGTRLQFSDTVGLTDPKIEINPVPFQIGLAGTLDFVTESGKPPLMLIGSLGGRTTPPGASLSATLPGVWDEPNGQHGVSISHMALDITTPPLLVGLAGTVTVSGFTGTIAVKVDPVNPVFEFDLDNIDLGALILMALGASGVPAAGTDFVRQFLAISFHIERFYTAAQATQIGALNYLAGTHLVGQMHWSRYTINATVDSMPTSLVVNGDFALDSLGPLITAAGTAHFNITVQPPKPPSIDVTTTLDVLGIHFPSCRVTFNQDGFSFQIPADDERLIFGVLKASLLVSGSGWTEGGNLRAQGQLASSALATLTGQATTGLASLTAAATAEINRANKIVSDEQARLGQVSDQITTRRDLILQKREEGKLALATAQTAVQNAQAVVDGLNVQYANMQAVVQAERDRDEQRLAAASAQVAACQSTVNGITNEINATSNWFYSLPKVDFPWKASQAREGAWFGAKMAGLYTARDVASGVLRTAQAALQVVQNGISGISINLDPRLFSIDAALKTANVALAAARAALTSTQANYQSYFLPIDADPVIIGLKSMQQLEAIALASATVALTQVQASLGSLASAVFPQITAASFDASLSAAHGGAVMLSLTANSITYTLNFNLKDPAACVGELINRVLGLNASQAVAAAQATNAASAAAMAAAKMAEAQAASGLQPVFQENRSDGLSYVFDMRSDEDARVYGWHNESIAFFAFATQVPGTVPVNRGFNSGAGYYFSTYDANVLTANGWTPEGAMFYAFPTQQPGTVPVMQEYAASLNRYHLSTRSAAEATQYGWQQLWVAFYAFPYPSGVSLLEQQFPAGSTVTIRCQANNQYLRVDSSGELFATANFATGNDTHFEVLWFGQVPNRWMGLRSKANSNYLRMGADYVLRADSVYFSADVYTSEHFRIDGDYIYCQAIRCYLNHRFDGILRGHGNAEPWAPAGKIPSARFSVQLFSDVDYIVSSSAGGASAPPPAPTPQAVATTTQDELGARAAVASQGQADSAAQTQTNQVLLTANGQVQDLLAAQAKEHAAAEAQLALAKAKQADQRTQRGGPKGVHEASLRFNGRSSFLTIPASRKVTQKTSDTKAEVIDQPCLLLGQQVTVEAWVRLIRTQPLGLGFSADRMIFCEGYDLILNVFGPDRGADQGKVEFGGAGLNPPWMHGNIPVDDGQWHHIAATYDGATRSIYVDGQLDARDTPTGALRQAQADTLIGKAPDNTHYLLGQIDEVRLWSTSLTQADIRGNRYRLLQWDEPGLQGNWRFDEAKGLMAYDQTANANHATLSSPPTQIGALQFNGGQYIELGDHDVFSEGLTATFEAWIYVDQFGESATSIFNKWNQNVEDEYLVGMDESGYLQFAWHTTGAGNWGAPSWNMVNSREKVALKQWTHIAVVRSGPDVFFFINGQEAGSLANCLDLNPFRNGATSLRLGGQGRGANRYFSGRLTDMRLWGVARNQGEILDAMYQPPASNETGLVGYWQFDEKSGLTVNDQTANHNHGTLTGNPTWATTELPPAPPDISSVVWADNGAPTIPPVLDSALQFNGGQYVELGDRDVFTEGLTATFEAWIYVDQFGELATSIFNKWSQSVEDEYLVGMNESGYLQFAWHTTGAGGWGSPSWNMGNSREKVALKQWTHIAVVRSGPDVFFFIDGQEAGSLLNSLDLNPFRNGATSLRIGAEARAGNRYFTGRLTDVRLWGVARNQGEIRSAMYRPLAGDELGLVGYWQFDEKSGNKVYDQTSNYNHGALVGNPTWATSEAPTVPPDFGNALTLAGAECVVIPDNPSLRFQKAFTFEAWVKLNTLDAQVLLCKGEDGNNPEFIVYLNAGISFFHGAQGWRWATRQLLLLNTWQHVALTFDGQTVATYVDGALVERFETPVVLPLLSEQALRMGQRGNQPQYDNFKGQLDEVRTWAVVRTPAELQVNMYRGLQGNEPGLVGYWRFDETEGDIVYDQTANSGHGALVGQALRSAASIRLSPATPETAIHLDGSGCILIPDSNSLRFQNAFSFEAWIKCDPTPAGSQVVLAKGNDGNNPQFIFYVNEGRLAFHDGRQWHYTSVEVAAQTWQYVAVTLDGNGQLTLYLDGNVASSVSGVAALPINGDPLRIGQRGSQPIYDNFRGQIDEVRLWTVARTQAEIRSNLYRSLRGNEPGLVGYWRFDEDSGNTIIDASSKGNSGKVIGVPAWSPSRELSASPDFGPVITWDGIDDYIELPTMSALGHSITLSAWVYVSAIPNTQQWLVGKSFRWQLIVNANGHVALNAHLINNFYQVQEPDPILPNQWVNYAGTLDSDGYGTTLCLYRNGELVARQEFGVIPSPDNGCQVFIAGVDQAGPSPYRGQFFNGQLDKVQIWDRALSAEEISNNLKLNITGGEAGLIGYWRLDERTEKIAYDQTAYHQHGYRRGAVG